MNPKAKAHQRIQMAEYNKAKKRVASGEISEKTLKEQFRGCVPRRGSKASQRVKAAYHAWLKENGHPIPKPKPLKKDRPKKKKRRSKKKKKEEE